MEKQFESERDQLKDSDAAEDNFYLHDLLIALAREKKLVFDREVDASDNMTLYEMKANNV